MKVQEQGKIAKENCIKSSKSRHRKGPQLQKVKQNVLYL